MEDRVKKIVDRLLEGTKGKKLSWEPTERSKEYVVKLDNTGITVDTWAGFDEDSGEQYNLADIAFLTRTGEVIERVVVNEDSEYKDYRELLNLHNAARRSYLRVDEKLDDILGEIEKKVGGENPA